MSFRIDRNQWLQYNVCLPQTGFSSIGHYLNRRGPLRIQWRSWAQGLGASNLGNVTYIRSRGRVIFSLSYLHYPSIHVRYH